MFRRIHYYSNIVSQMTNKLLLLHGALGSHSDFSELESILAHSFEIYKFNFSGHSGNELNSEFSIDTFVNDAKEFIEHHDVAPVSIFGYSMGGYVALKLAAKYPNLVNKIITLGTKFNWSKESTDEQVKLLDHNLIEQKVPKFAQALKEKHGFENWKTVLRKTADMMLSLGNGSAMTKEEFSQINHEVFICLGSDDNMVTKEESVEVTSYLKNGKLKIIEGFKHPIETINKTKLAEIIIENLQ